MFLILSVHEYEFGDDKMKDCEQKKTVNSVLPVFCFIKIFTWKLWMELQWISSIFFDSGQLNVHAVHNDQIGIILYQLLET